ncbi:M56 family metallopeptidase [Paenibacillus sp. 481]|uniref:M56 family metallopeptidase n=1 Tax=Paenibacillus sp. 481 TaxID=2835869 RepID=UPI001E2A2DC4|nr:M56 family metallopeptidase [Paenibacillus sp. 481]UHA75498.1 M56 family metallopeptidase [Paenibacillus sp. 481]
MMWEKRSKFIFASCLLIAGTLLSQMCLYVFYFLLDKELRLNIFQLCQSVLQYYGLTRLGHVFDAFVFLTVALIIGVAARQLYLCRRMSNKMLRLQNEALTMQLNEIYSEREKSITVIDHPEPIAVTMGLFNPRIVISTGLIHLLDDDELEAVIHHEMHHRHQADPLKSFVLYLFAAVLWFIPILKWSHETYKMLKEVMADHYSINKIGSATPLASALLKLVKYRRAQQMPAACISLLDSAVNYRIQKLIDPQTEIGLKLPVAPAIISAHALVVLCPVFIYALF